ncbi:MAG: hypothetical protein Q9222_003586 [Ikaeria aurantiellina]
MRSRANIIRRETSLEDTEISPYAHKYIIKRPVIKEYISHSNSNLHLRPTDSDTLPGAGTSFSPDSKDVTVDNPIVEKRRFELFIDLIWVGIVGNLAENFSEEAFSETSDTPVGRAVGNLILLFLTAWRLWKFLQIFMTKYHTNDLVERLFIVWILILALLFGNNAPYLLIPGDDQTNLAIIVYLIARVSFMAIETVYSFYIPFMRRGMLIKAMAALPLTTIWIGMIFVPEDRQIDVLIAVNALEFITEWAISAPLLAHFLREERAKPMDPDHWTERIREFFTIILGEGVLNLIRGSPLGRGLNESSGNGISVLIAYYILIAFYFAGDQSRRYIHAVKRAWWRKELWQVLHVTLFHALLILGVGLDFLLEHPLVSAKTDLWNRAEGEGHAEEEEALRSHMYTAKWTVSTALATTLAAQTLITLLSKSVDRKRTLKVDSRYLRLLPRMAIMVVVLCLPIRERMVASIYLTILVLMLVAVLIWEMVASLDSDGDSQWTSEAFQASTAIGLSYPTESCLIVNITAGQQPTQDCTIGDQPVYTINATKASEVATGIKFARRHNIRLVIRDTGHDILRRSTGYGSLQIWIKYLQKGIQFQETFASPGKCSKSSWKGSAFVIGGGYIWSDILGEAAQRGVVVVGGGTPTVGCLGGWMQGGGHGPAVHDFGLGADQVLEAEVVLANGQIVTANPCQHPDIFFAIRGGGGGTYGVVISTTVKAHPTTEVAAQQLSFAPLNSSYVPDFMEAVELIYNAYPDLSDQGFSGYGSWALASPTPLVYNYNYTLGGDIDANFTTGFTHTVAVFGKSAEEAKSIFAPIAAQLAAFNSQSLFINTTYSSFPTYAAYYTALSGLDGPVGQSAALGSRLLDRKALTSPKLNETLRTIVGPQEQFTSVNIVFVGGGQVARDAADPFSGVNPAWRTSYVHNIVARGWAPGADEATRNAVYSDITDVKVRAMKDLAPDTGAYMNELFTPSPHNRTVPSVLSGNRGVNKIT